MSLKVMIMAIIFSQLMLEEVTCLPRVFSRARGRTFWCSYLQGQVIPFSQSDTCIHGHVATPCGAICKKGPGKKINKKCIKLRL